VFAKSHPSYSACAKNFETLHGIVALRALGAGVATIH
jgi:hypothetical protein